MILESIIIGVCLCVSARTIGKAIIVAAKIRMGENWTLKDEDE